MKKTFACSSTLFIGLMILFSNMAQGQLLKRLKDDVKARAERKVTGKAGDVVDNTIDKTLNGAAGKKKDKSAGNDNNAETDGEEKAGQQPIADYKNYDFVAGDKIIFEPDLSKEPDAELPARFELRTGNAEIQTFNGEKILHLQPDANTSIAPLIAPKKYLPAQFTLEFDMLYENDDKHFRFVNYFQVQFRGADDTTYLGVPLFRFQIENNSRAVLGGQSATGQLFQGELDKSMKTGNTWHHVAIYVRNNIGKAYIDQYRVAATNSLPKGAAVFNISTDRYGIKIKNVRLAAGGDDKYNKVVTDGRFITHGILFDINKSSIKPESMGALNEIVAMMKEHKDLNFQIEGHTDSNGKPDANMKLSEERASAVREKLIEMGIEKSRLTAKGFGATKPIDKNETAEGKANNRRVEFVKAN
jgi:outer membrane protein OmpA-like peptidoglycan-associated protein